MKHGLFVQWVSHSHRGSARLWGSLGEDNGKKLEATMVVPIGCVKVCWTSHVEVYGNVAFMQLLMVLPCDGGPLLVLGLLQGVYVVFSATKG